MSFERIQDLRVVFWWLHVTGCFVALVFAALALSTRKGSAWHLRWGRGYVTLAALGTSVGFPLVMVLMLYAEQFGSMIPFKKIDDFFGLAPTALLLANLWNACEAVRRKRRLELRIASPTFAVNLLAVVFCGVVSAAFAGNPALLQYRVLPLELALRHVLLLGFSVFLLARARRAAPDLGWKFHHVANILTSLVFMLRALVAGAPSRFLFGRPLTYPRTVATFELCGALLQVGILLYYYSRIREEELARDLRIQ